MRLLKFYDFIKESTDTEEVPMTKKQLMRLKYFVKKENEIVPWENLDKYGIPEKIKMMMKDKYGLVKLEPTSKRDKYSKKCSVIFNDYKQSYRYSLNDLIDDRTNGISDKKLEYIGFSIKI